MEPRRAAAAVTAVLLAVTAGGTWASARSVDESTQQQFDRLADNARGAIESRVGQSTEVLFALGALFDQGDVTRQEFHDFVSAVDLARLPGLQAVSFNRRVPAGDLAAFESAVRSDAAFGSGGFPDFAVYPEHQSPEYHVVEYIEPIAGNESALGFDIASDDTRRAALLEARDSGDAVATRGIDLVQFRDATAGGRGVLVILPVYDPARDPKTAPERRRAFRGAVVVALHVDEMLRDVLGPRSPVAFEIYDVGPTVAGPRSTVHKRDLLFDGDDTLGALDPDRAPSPHRFLDMDVGGRRWRVFAQARGDLPGAPPDALTIAIGGSGAVLAVLVGGVVYTSARARARRRREMFDGYLRFTPEAVIVVNAAGEITHANARVEDLFGYAPDDLIGETVEVLLPERFRTEHVTHRAHYANEPRIREMSDQLDLYGRRRDGVEFPVEVGLSPLVVDAETVFAAAIRDVTQRHEAAHALRAALDREHEASAQLREMDALKDEFLDITAHELRTPLTSILGFTELLVHRRDTLANDRVGDLLSRIDANAIEMREMLTRLLDVSRLRAGRVELHPEPVPLQGALSEIVNRPRPSASEHVLSISVDDGLVAHVDPNAFDHVVSNLVSNAVKFSPPMSTVAVTARRTDREIIVAVTDDGPGIDPADVTRVFDHFFQGRSHAPGVRGVGVGLSIVKRYVDLWGGQVWVDSRLGAGATFSFTLPLARGRGDTDG